MSENLAWVMWRWRRISLTLTFSGRWTLNPSVSPAVGLHIVEAAHEFIEYALHGSSPVVGENLVGPLFQFVTLCHAEVGLHVLWKYRDQKDGELLVFVDVNDTRPAALAFTLSGKRNFSTPYPPSRRRSKDR